MKRSIYFQIAQTLALFCLTASTQPVICGDSPVPEMLTLGQCIELARAGSEDLENAAGRLRLDGIRIRDAQQKRWPSPSLSISDNRVIDIEEFSYYDPQTGQRYTPGEGYTASISLGAPLYTGGRLTSEIRYEQSRRETDRMTYESLQRDIWLDVVSNYLSVLQRISERDIRREQVVGAREDLKTAENRLATGKGIRYEVLREKAYLSEAELALMQAENNLNDSIRQLLILIRKPLDANIQLEDVPPPEPLQSDMDSLVEQAIAQREDIGRLNAEIAGYRDQIRILESERKPDVSFFASYVKQGVAWSDYPDDDYRLTAGISIAFSPLDNSSLSLSHSRERVNTEDYMQRSRLTYSLFDGSSRRAGRFELSLQIQLLKSQLAYMEVLITADVARAYERQMESWTACETERAKLEASEESFLIQTKRLELGLGQYNDLVEARTDVITARINLVYSRYKYTLDRAVFAHSVGSTLWR